MRNVLPILLALLAIATLASSAIGQAPATPVGTPGVEDGTCWKNSSGNEVTVSVAGTTSGGQDVTFTEGSNSGTAVGTPDPDGGCADSSSVSVGSESYRVKDGKVQWKNDSGTWINMYETECDD